MRYYKVAEFTMAIDLPEGIPVPPNMNEFEVEACEVDQTYEVTCIEECEIVDCLNVVADRWSDGAVMQRETMTIFTKDNRECRFLIFHGDNKPYAVSEQISDTITKVYILPEHQHMFQYDTVFSSILSMEKHLLDHDCMILHSAYLCHNGEAILFSAPSGTGKSTQAELWEKYRGSRQINGDDSVLHCIDGIWYASGFQVCGSSEICYNETYQIKTLVMLYQAKENTCRRLKPMEAFRLIYPQIKVNQWNQASQEKVFTMIEQLIMEVPVLELGCDISEEAVACLEEMIGKL